MGLAFRDKITETEYYWSKWPPCSNEASDAKPLASCKPRHFHCEWRRRVKKKCHLLHMKIFCLENQRCLTSFLMPQRSSNVQMRHNYSALKTVYHIAKLKHGGVWFWHDNNRTGLPCSDHIYTSSRGIFLVCCAVRLNGSTERYRMNRLN